MASPDPIQPTRDATELQLWSDGTLRHLLTLKGLERDALHGLLDHAEQYLVPRGGYPARSNALAGRTIANLFFEPSTRTRASFELAAKRLSADVLNLDVNMSSRIKGESILDTIYTLEAMHCDVFVVRDASAGVPALIAEHVGPDVAILNAGEADVAHPTQGLLDALTIRQAKGRIEDLVVTIVGDVAHSRVARSAAEALNMLGVGELRLVAPPQLTPSAALYPGAVLTDSLDAGLDGADVVMALRIQRERIENALKLPSSAAYRREYGITATRLERAKPDAVVLHPGPMNRGVEIDGDVADGPRSLITRQVTNGVAVRMAVLATILGNRARQ